MRRAAPPLIPCCHTYTPDLTPHDLTVTTHRYSHLTRAHLSASDTTMGIFSRAKQAKREIFQTFDKETVAKSFADFIALDESLSALSSEPFTGAVALKAKVDAYLALSDQATELKLISKNIADVPTESAQKACEAMVGKLGPVPVLGPLLLPCAAGCVTQDIKPEEIAKLNSTLKDVIPGLDDITKELKKMIAAAPKPK